MEVARRASQHFLISVLLLQENSCTAILGKHHSMRNSLLQVYRFPDEFYTRKHRTHRMSVKAISARRYYLIWPIIWWGSIGDFDVVFNEG